MSFIALALSALVACQSQTAPDFTPVSMDPKVLAERSEWPSTLDEAHARLDRILKSQQITQIRRTPYKDIDRYHRSLGAWIRNEMGLWRNGPIMTEFANAGIGHPDDVSTIIIRTYWRKLNGQSSTIQSEFLEWRKEADRVLDQIRRANRT
jgi:hypothetical protein